MTLFKRLRWEYEHGVGTIRGVANKYRVHRRTVRAALKSPVPPKRKAYQRERPKMAPLIPLIDAILETDLETSHPHRHTAHQIWTRIQTDISGADVSESTIRAYVQTKKAQLGSFQERTAQSAATWMMEVLQSDDPLPLLERELRGEAALASLARFVQDGQVRERNKALAILGRLKGIGGSVLAQCLQLSRSTIKRYFHRFQCGGVDALFIPPKSKKKEDPECGPFLFSLLHSPPSVYGINRTSWKMEDLHRILAENGHRTSRNRIRILIQEAGFKWRKAKVVLTSRDPQYRTKVDVIKKVLSNLKNDEAFFSIDEYGPFAIKRKGGTKRVGPGEDYVIPQWQKSKGWMILTAALELSRNQITHFYSLKKNTDEMIKMADLLRSQYRTCTKIYLSWDAASWHISKKLFSHLDE